MIVMRPIEKVLGVITTTYLILLLTLRHLVSISNNSKFLNTISKTRYLLSCLNRSSLNSLIDECKQEKIRDCKISSAEIATKLVLVETLFAVC